VAELSTYTKVVVYGLIVFAVGSVFMPNFRNGVRTNTQAVKALSNAKAIGFCCKSYAIDHGGNYPPSLEALVPTYLSDRRSLASPLMPSAPVGYIYYPGLRDTSQSNSALIEDKYAPAILHGRLIVYADDSALIDFGR
jgi:hypothetical protein